METQDYIANAKINIKAPLDEVWRALVDPEKIKKYMFGTTISTDWREGSKISWKGEWEGKPYEDKGVILQMKPKKLIQYSHYRPVAGDADLPENYHTVTIELIENGNHTIVTLRQDHNLDEEARMHSEKNWKMMLDSLKKLLET